MKKIFYLLAFVCLFILNVKAQPLLQYSNTYSYPGTGSEFGISIAADDSGNAYVTGITDANGNNDIITIKYSPNGTKLWEKIYIGTGNDDDKPVKVMTKNNKVYVTGYTYSAATGYDWVTISYNASNGNENWIKTYNDPNNGDDKATDIELDNAGNIYVSGSSYNNTTGKMDALLTKYNSNGNKIRDLTETNPNYNLIVYDFAVNTSSQIIFSYCNAAYSYIISLDSAFNQIGANYFTTTPIVKKIIPYQNYYYALITLPYESTNGIRKIQIGSTISSWYPKQLTSHDDLIIDFDIDASENIYAIYYDTIFNGSTNSFRYAKISSVGSQGDSIYTRIFDPTDQIDRPFKIKVGKQSTPIVYITGNTLKDGKTQNYTVGYNSGTGTALWTLNQSCSSTGDKSMVDLQLDNYNNIYLTGHSNCSGNDDALTVKYCASLPVANAGVDKITCAGIPTQIGGASLPNYIYSWSPAIGLSNAAISNPFASSNATYILTVTSPSGCSSNDTVNVTVNPLPSTPTITQSHDTLFSSVILTGATYNWYKGATNIANTSTSFYKIPSNGAYTLKITNSNGCISTVSNSLNATITGLRNTSSIVSGFELYPNPASENLNINIQSKQNANIHLSIFDVSGKEMFINDIKIIKGETLQKIDVSKFSKGIYVIQLTDEDGITTNKFVIE